MSTRTSRTAFVVALACYMLGFLIPYWLFAALGIAIMVAASWPVCACVFALIVDLLWGAPLGFFHFDPLPFTTLTLLGTVLRVALMRYLRD